MSMSAISAKAHKKSLKQMDCQIIMCFQFKRIISTLWEKYMIISDKYQIEGLTNFNTQQGSLEVWCVEIGKFV